MRLLILLLLVPSIATAAVDTLGSLFSGSTPCSSAGQFNRYEATSTVELTEFQVALGGADGLALEFFVYEATSSTGPYTRIWTGFDVAGAAPLQPSGLVQEILVAGNWYLLGAFIDDLAWTDAQCYASADPAQVYASISWGSADEGGGVASSPPSPFATGTTPTSFFQSITTNPADFPPTLVHNGPFVTDEANPSILIDLSGSTDGEGAISEYGFHCNALAAPGVQTSGATATHTCSYADDDRDGLVRVRVVDTAVQVVEEEVAVTINNLPPTATGACVGNCAVDEGTPLSFDCTGTDPSTLDVLDYAWDFGAGFVAGASQSFTWNDEGSVTATCRVQDDDGGVDVDGVAVTVFNVAPVLNTVTIPTTLDEGQPGTFVASGTDPGDDVLTYTWSFGDGTPDGAGDAVDHTYADDGSVAVTVTIDDGDGGVFTSPAQGLFVANVAPTVTGTCPAGAQVEGSAVTLSADATDPGDDTPAWSGTHGTVGGDAAFPGTGTLTWTPTFADAIASPVAVSLSVDDGDGGTGSLDCSVEVAWLDVDGDGVPDTWEDANGLDSSDPSDGSADPDGDGIGNADEWAQGTDPQSFDGPTEPTLLDPHEEEEPDPQPELSWANSTSPRGAAITYAVEVYEDDTLAALVTSTTGIVQAEGDRTEWTVDVPLAEDSDPVWRVRADDGAATSAWVEATFFVNEVEEPPPTPTLLGPPDGDELEVVPELTWTAVEDAEGTDVDYVVELYEDAALTLLVEDEEVDAADEPDWTPPLLIEGTVYYWRVQAVDGADEVSDWTPVWSFAYRLPVGDDDDAGDDDAADDDDVADDDDATDDDVTDDDDAADDDDGDDDDSAAGAAGCEGCSAAGGAGGWLLLPLLFAARRQR